MTRAQYLVWVSEVGLRAALRAESLLRDMRWWRGLWPAYAAREVIRQAKEAA